MGNEIYTGGIVFEANLTAYGSPVVSSPDFGGMYGPWIEITPATTADADAIFVFLMSNLASTGTKLALDIGIGLAGAERVLIPKITIQRMMSDVSSSAPVECLLPIKIPQGSRLAIRTSGNATSSSMLVKCLLVKYQDSPYEGSYLATSYGVSENCSGTVIDPGSSFVKGKYYEITPATVGPIKWLAMFFMTDQPGAGTMWTVDIAVGEAGSESILLPDFVIQNYLGIHPCSMILPFDIVQGSRISARAQCSSITLPDRDFELGLIGIG